MSFNYYLRKARDPGRAIAIRKSAVGSCLLRLGWLTGQARSTVANCLARRVGFDALHPETEAQFTAVLDALEITRNRILEQVRTFDRKRLREKWRHQRCPSPAQVMALQASKWAILQEAGPSPPVNLAQQQPT